MNLLAEFEILGLPQTINQIGRSHWSKKYKESKKWHRLVIEQCVFKRVCGLNLKSAVLEFTRHSSRQCDFDNLVTSFKHVLDGLVRAQVIINDTPTVVGSPTFIWKKVKRTEAKITVKIYSP